MESNGSMMLGFDGNSYEQWSSPADESCNHAAKYVTRKGKTAIVALQGNV